MLPIDHEMIMVAATVSLYAPGVHAPLRCSVCSVAAAWAHVMLARLGTATLGGPSESDTVMIDPSLRLVPGLGLWLTTDPAPMVMDFTGASSLSVMWSLATSACALVRGRLTRVGTGCDGVKTWVAKAAARPPAMSTTAATAATIHQVRLRLW